MKGLLSNALYTLHYTPKKTVEPSQWEKFRHVLQRLADHHDIVPLAGTTAGLVVGGSIIILFLSIWYLCLCRRRRRQSSASEYVNLLSMVSRATSDDSHYNQQQRRPRKKTTTNWWNLLLSKKSRCADSPIPKMSGPACYLLYEPENGGQLVQFYTAIPLDLESSTNHERTVVAIWKRSSHIPSHKFTTHAGRTVLTTNGTLGFQGKHNYCQGICKFVQAAFSCGGGSITLLTVQDQPTETNLYLYLNDSRPQYQTMYLDVGKTHILPSNSLAVACVPIKTVFHKNKLVDIYQWLEDGEREGSSIRF
jgi:hypothetical protein